MTPENEVQLTAQIAVSSGPATTWTTINQAPLPASYRPLATKTFPVGTDKLAVPSSPNNSGALARIDTSGNIQVWGISTSATEIFIEARIPLDV